MRLNEPDDSAYWNYEGAIHEKHWPAILKHLSSDPYPRDVLKWQGLAVIVIQTHQGDEITVDVYNTGDSVGCFRCGGYFTIPDEAQFVSDLKAILDSK